MRLLGPRVFDNLIVLSASQQRVLIDEIGVPSRRVSSLLNWVDHRFYRPQAAPRGPGDYVLSVGMEVRDYETLLEAGRGLSIPIRIVASGFSSGPGFAPAAGLFLQANVTVGTGYTPVQLRDLYAGARLVVVPLHPVGYAAGVTAALEAMSMGKPVVATASPGLLDYLRTGDVGRLVPPHDPAALRRSIQELWGRPEEGAAIGRRNRTWIELHDNTDLYVEQVARLMGWPEVERAKRALPG
jgi:glycosyltransferase involved in cell wall biosynthesis